MPEMHRIDGIVLKRLPKKQILTAVPQNCEKSAVNDFI